MLITDTTWILLDTETTGFRPPIFCVELAAQTMRGWEPVGPPMRALIDHGRDIPAEASRIHGYTRQILAAQGFSPLQVYSFFRQYAAHYPLCSYNLEYDLDRVLIPEWGRLRVEQIGTRGLCILRLTRALLETNPAGNHQLQTIKQHFNLSPTAAHSALGDLATTIDLLRQILKPKAEAKGVTTWEDLRALTA